MVKPRGDGIVMREWRERHTTLSVRELAKLVGVSATHISQIERGIKTARPELALLIADALGGPVDVFFDRELHSTGNRSRVGAEVAGA